MPQEVVEDSVVAVVVTVVEEVEEVVIVDEVEVASPFFIS